MPGSVEVIAPFRSNGCPYRERAWEWCREQYEYPVVEARLPGTDSDDQGQGAGDSRGLNGLSEAPWIKALAVMPAVERSEAEIVIVADADVHCQGLSEAVEAVRQGDPWAVPHREVVRLTEEGTDAYMAGARWQDCKLERFHVGYEGGGLFVIPRETFLQTPMDRRFQGWGQEDHALGFALYAIHGESWRGPAQLVHLWHPTPQRLNRKKGSHENWALWRRYDKARWNPDAMRALVEEGR